MPRSEILGIGASGVLVVRLMEGLRNFRFVRIHRSILVSKAYIKSFAYDEVNLFNGDKLPVSRGNYSILKESMEI